jgi:toxin HigB-1
MIVSFLHKGLEAFFRTGSKKGINPLHEKKLRLQLAALDSSQSPIDMDLPGWKLHELQGDRKGTWSIWVNGNWRITFKFSGGSAEVVNYEDYH